eukprot:3410289-Amphidinium_carterae.2
MSLENQQRLGLKWDFGSTLPGTLLFVCMDPPGYCGPNGLRNITLSESENRSPPLEIAASCPISFASIVEVLAEVPVR